MARELIKPSLARLHTRDERRPSVAASHVPDTRVCNSGKAQPNPSYRRLDKDYTPLSYPGRVIILWPGDDIEREQAPRWWRAVAREVDFVLFRATIRPA